jgi:FkbM family methyltransferase
MRRAAVRLRHEFIFDEDTAVWHALRGSRDGVMIDVGAHEGSWHWLADRGWTIYAYEPDPDNRARIPPRSSVFVSSAAVSDRAAERATFFASSESTGISSLSAFTSGHQPRCEVPVTTLSHEIERLGLTRCDFLKIDTEGHDLFVLRGFPWLKLAPDVILCEFEDRKTRSLGYRYTTLADLLVDRGYTVFMSEWFPIVRYGSASRWRRIARYPAATQDPDAWGNFLAFRDEGAIPGAITRHAV